MRLRGEWELVRALGCRLDDIGSESARRLLLMEAATSPALGLMLTVPVVSDYTCQRRTGEAMQWELSASWE